MTISAGRLRALLIIFSLLPGTEIIDRLNRVISLTPYFGNDFAYIIRSHFGGLIIESGKTEIICTSNFWPL
jgi:hypothetical protein